MTKLNRSFDIIVYGATSFVGQILTEYLGNYTKEENAEAVSNIESVSWAIAGRSEKTGLIRCRDMKMRKEM